MICRNPDKAKDIRAEIISQHKVEVYIIKADFSVLDDVRKAVDILLKDYPRIDVLINSAGLYSTTRTTTQDGFETVFCVNHLAPFLLTYNLIDRLKQSAPARIIQVNSEGHRFGGLDLSDLNWKRRPYIGLRGYGASKVAQLLTTWEFADRLQGIPNTPQTVIVAWLDPTHPEHQSCTRTMHRAAARDLLAVSSVTYAEMAAGARTQEGVDEVLRPFHRVDLDFAAAWRAGQRFRQHRPGRKETVVLPDFFIRGQAAVLGIPHLTNDRRRLAVWPDVDFVFP